MVGSVGIIVGTKLLQCAMLLLRIWY